MPTIRYTGGGRYRVAGTTFESGDEAGVEAGTATYLVDEIGEFEYADAPSEVPHVSSDDIEALLGGTVDDVTAALEAGEYDTVLGQVADAESAGADRVGVHDAIAARQDTLDESGG